LQKRVAGRGGPGDAAGGVWYVVILIKKIKIYGILKIKKGIDFLTVTSSGMSDEAAGEGGCHENH